MSDFLLNLARRSAGLAPTVRARAMPSPGGGDALDLEAHVGATSERSLPNASASIEMPRVAQVATVSQSTAVAPSPAPLVLAPAAAPARTARRTAAASATAAAVSAAPRTAEPSSGAPPATAQSAAPREAPNVPNAASTAIASSAIRDNEPWTDALDREPRHSASDTPAPLVVRIEPADAPAVPAAAAPLVSTPERTIHVNIGAIEIIGDEGQSAARPALEPPSQPAESSRASGSTASAGFDDFAALRSYAPWTW